MNVQPLHGPQCVGTHPVIAAYIKHSVGTRFYTYLLCRPDGTPFYVGKGKGRRVLEHELEARRNVGAFETNPLKSNVIRKIIRLGGEVQYQIDRVFEVEQEVVCLAREADLIKRYKRLHEGGILTNLAGGMGNPSSASPLSKKRHEATLSGEPFHDPDRAVLNRYLRSFGPVGSTCIKPLSHVRKLAPTTPHSSPRKPTVRMCYALMASAVAHGLALMDGVVIPRRFEHYPDREEWPANFALPRSVSGLIERGVSRDILKAGLADLVPAEPVTAEAFRLNRAQIDLLVSVVGETDLEQRGLI